MLPAAIKRRVIILATLIIIAFVLIFSYIHITRKSKKQHELPQISVAASSVQQKTVTVITHAIGNVQAYNTVNIKSLVDGQLIKVNFHEGDKVTAGQLLFIIDPKPFEAALHQTEGNLAKDQVQLENAKSLVKRNAQLAKQGYIAAQDYDQLIANEKVLAASVQSDHALLANAKLQLSYCYIYAPISGRTGNLLLDQGNLVKANDTTSIVTINQISPIYVSFTLPEMQLGSIKRELAKGPLDVTVKTDKHSPPITGAIRFVNNTVDTTTGSIEFKASFANADEKLWPGQFVNVHVPLERMENALVIPTSAVLAGQKGNYVYVINKDHKVSNRAITQGPGIGLETVIEQGLKPGELVVTEGQLRLSEGTPVGIVKSGAQG